MSTEQNSGSLKDKFAGFGAEPTEGLFDSIYHASDGSIGSLSTKFEGFGAEPSAGLWDSIAAEMDGKRKRRVVIWWSSGIAAIFLIGLGLTWSGMFGSSEQQYSERELKPYSGQVEESTVDNAIEENESGSGNSEDLVEYNSGIETSNSTPENNADNRANNSNPNQEQNQGNNIADNRQENNQSNKKQNSLNNEVADLSDVKNMPLMNAIKIPVNPSVPPIEFEQVRNKKSWWEIGVEYEYWAAIADPITKKEDGLSYFSSTPTTAGNNVDSGELFEPIATADGTLALAENASYNNQPAAYGKVTKPLNLNFLLRYNFNKRFALHSGLNYSRHFYRTTYSAGEIQYTASTVNSFGIPLGFKWSFFNRPDFGLYTDAQQLFEIPLSERREEVYQAYAAEKNDLQRNFTTGLMLSFQTGLGMRFTLTERMSLNAGMNLRYYYLQRANGTAPLHEENMWLSGKVGLNWRI